jgi:hypothetical protein
LEPKLRLTGVVENRNGVRVAGAELHGSATVLGDGAPEFVRGALESESGLGLWGASNAEGRFELFYTTGTIACFLNVSVDRGDEHYTGSHTLRLESQGTENVVVLLDCPDEVARGSVQDLET